MVGAAEVVDRALDLTAGELVRADGERQQQVRLARSADGVTADAHLDLPARRRGADRPGGRPVHGEGQRVGREGPERVVVSPRGEEQADVGADQPPGSRQELLRLLVGEQDAPGPVEHQDRLAAQLEQFRERPDDASLADALDAPAKPVLSHVTPSSSTTASVPRPSTSVRDALAQPAHTKTDPSRGPSACVVSEAGLEPARPFSQSLAPQASASANSATPTCHCAFAQGIVCTSPPPRASPSFEVFLACPAAARKQRRASVSAQQRRAGPERIRPRLTGKLDGRA